MEAVRLVVERGVSMAQATSDSGMHSNALRNWVRKHSADPQQAFPSVRQQKRVDEEVTQLRLEVSRLRQECDIPKQAAAYFAKESMWNSASWQDIEEFGQWRCSARRSGSR